MRFEFEAGPETLRALRLIAAANDRLAFATHQQTRATLALVRVLHSLTNRNATSVEFGPLQIIDKPKE